MRKLVDAFLLVIFVAWVLFGSWYAWQSSLSPLRTEATHEQPTDETSPKSTADERIAAYTGWLATFTLALVIVSAVQIRFLIRADETARITATAAKQSADAVMAAETAQVRILPKSHKYWEVAGKYADFYPNSPGMGSFSNRITSTYAFKNYGKSLAILQEAHVRLQCSTKPPELITGFVPMLTLPDERVLAAGAVTDDFTSDLDSLLMMQEAISINEGELSIWLIGYVLYRDRPQADPQGRQPAKNHRQNIRA